MNLSIIYAFSAVFLFSLASIAFTSISNKSSVAWMNYFKSAVACISFFVFAYYFDFFKIPDLGSIGYLAVSGILGLCIGDMFLLKAYTVLGPGRTLILFSFHPLITGIASYFLFGQEVSFTQLLAILFMVSCIILLGRERLDEKKSWNFIPILIALAAIGLDAFGVILTRIAFDRDPSMDSSLANFVRSLFSFFAFALWSTYRPIGLVSHFKNFSRSFKVLAFCAAFFGTFVSLLMYLNALKYGHLATVSAIAATGPIWSATFEFLFFKQKPSKTLIQTFVMFAIGMVLLNY